MAHGSERVIDDIREHAYQISVSFFIICYFFLLGLFAKIWFTADKWCSYCFLCDRHCQISSISTPVGKIKETMLERNLRVLWFL